MIPVLLLATTENAKELSVFERVEADDKKIRVRFDKRDYVLVAVDGFDTGRAG